PVVIDTLTNMRRLEALFGMNRKRFPKLPVPRGQRKLYDWRAVVEIMRALLKEKRRKGKKRGPRLRRWLGKPARRARVLGGLEERIKTVCTNAGIARAFLDLTHPPSLS